MKQFLIDAYFKVYKLVAQKRIENADLPERFIHTHLVCVISTGALMWAYAFLAYFTIDHPLPSIVGFSASLVHFFSPLLYRLNKNSYINTNVFLGAGICHQATFAFFIGGFYSNIIIWFGILPMLAGVVCGRKGVITWLIVCSAVTGGFLYLQATGYQFPRLISPTGLLLSQALITFGWIFASSLIIWVFLLLIENHQKEIEKKKDGIQNLLFVISHDISNPLTVINTRSTALVKASELPEKIHGSIVKISSAGMNITDIVNNVRNMYATEIGKKQIELSDVKLEAVLVQLKENFSDKLEAKKINLVLHYSEVDCIIIRTNADLLLHQILGNLLSNAIKFSSPESKINLNLSRFNNQIFIQIKDSGIGIPKTLIDKLFDVGVKTNRKGTSGEAGTGFGLPIVKTYVELLNGKITVISNDKADDPERGTIFTLAF